MIVVQRRNKIKEILLKERSVRVSKLVQEFDVSEETIRRDLYVLEKEGFVKKNYGGAILVEELQNAMSMISPVEQRKLQFFNEKDAIGRKAAELIEEGQIIILDAGSTTWCMAKHLKAMKNLMIVTNGVNVAEECSQNDNVDIFVVGGKLVNKSMSLVGPQAELEVQKYNAHYVFLGTSAISMDKGFTSSDIYEAELKRAMIGTGQKVVVLADHSKFGKQSLITYSSMHEVDILITSDLTDPSVIEAIRNKGVQVITCRVDTGN